MVGILNLYFSGLDFLFKKAAAKGQMTLGFAKCPYFLPVLNPSYRTCCGRYLGDLAGGKFFPCFRIIKSHDFDFILADESL